MKLIIFDCDGVLIDSEIIADQVVLAYCQEQFPALDFSAWAQRMNGVMIRDILHGMETDLGIRFADQATEVILQRMHERLRDVQAVASVAEALPLLCQPKAVASNSTSGYVRQMLTRTGLIQHFGDAVFGADLVQRAKPAPDLYLLAAQTCAVTPTDCLVIEDSVTGITAAHSAGMTVIGFVAGQHSSWDRAAALRAAGARAVIDDLNALQNLNID